MDGTHLNPLIPLEYVVLGGLLLLAAALVLTWQASTKVRPGLRATLCLARFCVIAALLVIALNPGQWRHGESDRDPLWMVLIDRSASMTVPDVGGVSRWEAATDLARRFKEAAGDDVRVELHPFTGDLESAVEWNQLRQLPADGSRTELLRTGSSLLGRLPPGAAAEGILVLSDGRQSRQARHTDFALRAAARGAPVHAVVLGGDVPVRDLELVPGRRRYVAFPGQRLRLTAKLTNHGMGPVRPEIRLIDFDGDIVDTKTVELEDGESATALFEITPDADGIFDYHLATPVLEGESIEENNEADITVQVMEGRLKVFMAEGLPYWDSKFLAQLLRRQPNLEVTSVYRVTEDRFFKVDTGLAGAAEETETPFPDSLEELAEFDLVVLGRGVEFFLTPERIENLTAFVRDLGGALIFARGKPYDGEFPVLEPLEPVRWGQPFGRPFRFRPAYAGVDVGLFGDRLAGADDPLWEKLPDLRDAHQSGELSSFSRVLVEGVAEIAGQRRVVPIVINRRYGQGNVTVVNADGIWEWGFFPLVDEAEDMYEEFWGQLMQWAATHSDFLPGEEFSLRLSETRVYPETPVRARAGLRRLVEDEARDFRLEIRRDAETVMESTLQSMPDEAGQWSTVFSLPEPGRYRVALHDRLHPDEAGPQTDLTVRPWPSELEEASADPAFLERLTRETGGRLVEADEAPGLLRDAGGGETPVELSDAHWEPAWDRAWLLLILVGGLASEWILRRRNGLL